MKQAIQENAYYLLILWSNNMWQGLNVFCLLFCAHTCTIIVATVVQMRYTTGNGSSNCSPTGIFLLEQPPVPSQIFQTTNLGCCDITKSTKPIAIYDII